jgi:predicted ATPase
MMRLKTITLLRDRVESWHRYPFNVPAIQSLGEIEIKSRICYFVGENGSGKSTLLEAVATHYGFGYEGGNRNFSSSTTDSVRAIDPLVRALRVAFMLRTGKGFYLRAESFFNIATSVDDIGFFDPYGGKSLHEQSHGESFLALLKHRFTRKGFYVMDEPEAALSPQRQLSFLVLLHDLLENNNDIQFLIATHSPIVLALPGAQILSFDDGRIREIAYEETLPAQIYGRFLRDREGFLRQLFSELDFQGDKRTEG